MPDYSLTAQAVADLVGGRLSGPGEVRLTRVRSLASAGPDALAACAGQRWLTELALTGAGAVLVAPAFADAPGPATRIVVTEPRQALAVIAAALHPTRPAPRGVAATADIGAGAVLGAGVSVGAFTVIGTGTRIGRGARIESHVVIGDDVVIGDEVHLEPRVVIYSGAVLGDRVYCQAGAVVGSPGFGFLTSAAGAHQRVPQVGGCVLGDDVEVGAGSCIDRGSVEDTVIGRGTKIDNLVHIGHNVHIGEDCLLMAGVGVAGSTHVGNRVVLAGQSGLSGHLVIGDDARVAAQAGVIGSIPPRSAVSGYPARPHREYMRAQAVLYRLAPHLTALERLVADREETGDE